MNITQSNTIYIFKDNKMMDSPENILAHVCLDDISDMNKWFEDTLEDIEEKYFIQFMFSNGSIIKCFSGKKGHVKSIKLWHFNESYADGKRLDYFLCTPKGIGSKHISYKQFVELFQSPALINGDYKKDFTWRTRSHEGDTNPKEPLLLINLRLDTEKNRQLDLDSNIPSFCLEDLKIKPYELAINTSNDEFYHLISTKQDLLSFLKGVFNKEFIFENLAFPAINLEFKNEEQQGEVVYFMVSSIEDYDGFNASCSLDIHLNNFQLSAVADVNSIENLVDIIFFIPQCDERSLLQYFKVKNVTHKEPKIREKSKSQEIKSFTQSEFDELTKAIDLSLSQIIRFENEDNWLELAPISESQWCANFYYSSKENPLDFFKNLNINIPKGFELDFWEANLACTFNFDSSDENKSKVALFIGDILSKLFNVTQLCSLEIGYEEF